MEREEYHGMRCVFCGARTIYVDNEIFMTFCTKQHSDYFKHYVLFKTKEEPVINLTNTVVGKINRLNGDRVKILAKIRHLSRAEKKIHNVMIPKKDMIVNLMFRIELDMVMDKKLKRSVLYGLSLTVDYFYRLTISISKVLNDLLLFVNKPFDINSLPDIIEEDDGDMIAEIDILLPDDDTSIDVFK